MIYISVPLDDGFGAGVMGSNLVPALAALTDIRLLFRVPPGHPLAKYVARDWNPERPYAVDEPMLHLATGGASFLPFNREVWSWKRNVGYAFIEFPRQAVSFLPDARRYYDHIVAGSSWCEHELRAMGLTEVSHAIQGINFDLFHPEPSVKPKDDGKFYIFSGGKAEYRKGTDIVIAAFKTLSQKYKDMHLIAAWGNHWIETMNSLSFSKHIKWVSSVGTTWKQRIQANLTFNGIMNDRYTLVDFMPNFEMAKLYRSCHLGVFPNRCEAGTNMVLTEAMACGLPVVATDTTGHSDIVNSRTAYCGIDGVYDENGFYEPTIDSVVAEIEKVYSRGESSHSVGWVGAQFVRQLTWEKCARDILDQCVR
jgi:glycosyltransferase involved in cell wall biosynthesis